MSRAVAPRTGRAFVVACVRACVLTSMLALPRGANAEAPPECTRAYIDAQEQRRAGRLQRAHEALVRCGAASCPPAFVADCAEWLREVERATPTFVVAVTGPDGAERTDATVTVDGVVVANATDGRAIGTDPGAHDIGARLHGQADLTLRVVLREGEKDRGLHFRFPPRAAPPLAPLPSGPSRITTAS